MTVVLCFRGSDISLAERSMASKALIQRISYFTGGGAVYVDGSNIGLRGETVFANNTADYGGTTVKFTLWPAFIIGRTFY